MWWALGWGEVRAENRKKKQRGDDPVGYRHPGLGGHGLVLKRMEIKPTASISIWPCPFLSLRRPSQVLVMNLSLS
jgi:hypothetical protein